MFLFISTTLNINDELLRAARGEAAKAQSSLRSVVERARRTYLGRRGKTPEYRLRWRTERGRLRPGVRLDDRDALFELIDGHF